MLLAALCGCAHVAPWERELLADPAMTFGSESEEDAATGHALDYREGGVRAESTHGGGCGCR